MTLRVGFVGLGDMGLPMARNLCGGDFEVVVFDLRPEAMQELEEHGASAAASCREVGERCEMIGVCVVDDAGTETVVQGEEGLLAGAKAGTVIAIHGTVHPATVRRIAEQASARGVDVLDAQVTGGRSAADAQRLRYMVGGDEAVLQRCRAVFETSGSEITYCGPSGAGAVAKLCNNLVQFQAWQGYVEASLLASHAGLSQEALLSVLGWIMNDNARIFLAARNALEADPANELLLERFGQAQQLAEKDLGLALEVARQSGVAMPGTALVQQLSARLFGLPDRRRR